MSQTELVLRIQQILTERSPASRHRGITGICLSTTAECAVSGLGRELGPDALYPQYNRIIRPLSAGAPGNGFSFQGSIRPSLEVIDASTQVPARLNEDIPDSAPREKTRSPALEGPLIHRK